MDCLREVIIKHRKTRLENLVKMNTKPCQDLDAEKEQILLRVILAMPTDKQNVLILRDYYNHSFEDMRYLLGLEDPEGEYKYLVSILSEALGLEDSMISSESMKKVCREANHKINEEIYIELGNEEMEINVQRDR